jgi:hypothetical protein
LFTFFTFGFSDSDSYRKHRPKPVNQPVASKKSSNDSMRPNTGESNSQSTLSRPVSLQKGSEPNEQFQRLKIDSHESSTIVPSKRLLNQPTSPGPVGRGEGRGSAKSKRTKPVFEADYTRPSKNTAGKTLFDAKSSDIGRSKVVPSFQAHPRLTSIGPPPKAHQATREQPKLRQRNGLIEQSRIPAEQPQTDDDGDDDDDDDADSSDSELLLQPETRPISHEQLVHEVKGIYAGLVMVEAKCIDVDEKQSREAQERDPAKRTTLTPEQYSALIALHKTLLHEHHDFFLASQHPSASPALTKLAEKYSMPARMWRHGIHSFLEGSFVLKTFFFSFFFFFCLKKTLKAYLIFSA